MDIYLKGFTKIHNKEIRLHKIIDDNDICVIIGDFRRIYIMDRKDIDNTRITHYYNIQKTIVMDNIIALSNWTTNYIVYPYISFKTIEEMNMENILNIKNNNKFIDKDCELSQVSIIINLTRIEKNYYLEYWCNDKILNNIYNGKRELRISTIKYLACLEKNSQIINTSNEKLDKIMNCNNENQNQLENINYNFDDSILNNISLFNYQKNDIKWLQLIENNILNNNNEIEYKSNFCCDIINNDFTLLNDKIYPKWMINRQYKTIHKKFKYFGGSLISELGLGKTLVILYHIINNSNRDKKFIDFNNTCSYFYKRGKLTGTSCEKHPMDDSLFCKEHKNSLFCDKRPIIYKNLEMFNISDYMLIDKSLFKTNSNLIICPSHLCDQWVKECYEKFNTNSRIILIVTKDQWKNVTLGDILFSDIVITSYNLLLSNWYIDATNSKNYNPINNIEHMSKSEILNCKNLTFNIFKWDRLVLDEVHEITENHSNANWNSRLRSLHSYITNISYNFIWNISGTPFANGIFGYLYLMSLISNLDVEILHKNQFSTSDLIDIGLNDNLIDSTNILFKRNTKKSINSELEENIIKHNIHMLTFTKNERCIYDSYVNGDRHKYINFLIKLCCDCQFSNNKLINSTHTFEEISKILLDENNNQINDLKKKIDKIKLELYNLTTCLKNLEDYLNTQTNLNNEEEIENIKNEIENHKKNIGIKKKILTNTIKNKESQERISNYLQHSIAKIRDDDNCTICLDVINEIGITKCGHKFCWECISKLFDISNNTNIKCPNCNEQLTNNDIFLLRADDDNKYNELESIINDVKSTKIGNIIHFLKDKKDEKFIIFSQWDEILQKVGNRLNNYGFKTVYCNGSVYNRKRSIQSFTNDPTINIIMLSSKYAASGINLTQSHNIVLIEPIYGNKEWRINIENQAIGRADRIGQKSPINVWRFIIKDTIEEDILNDNLSDSDIERIIIE